MSGLPQFCSDKKIPIKTTNSEILLKIYLSLKPKNSEIREMMPFIISCFSTLRS